MFQLRKETDYAIQFLKSLSRSKKECLSLGEIAKETNISFLFLQKIARKLRLAKIIKAKYGVNGGYSIDIPANKLTLKFIIETMEGRCGLLACSGPNGHCECASHQKCGLKIKMDKVNDKILKILNQVKLEAL